MSDLLTWYRAQLDEDERLARAATPGPWIDYETNPRHPDFYVEQPESLGGHLVAEFPVCVEPGHDDRRAADARFVGEYHPGRALAEVQTKRRLLDGTLEALRWADSVADGEYGAPEDYAGAFLRTLALPYAHRPGYLDEWRP